MFASSLPVLCTFFNGVKRAQATLTRYWIVPPSPGQELLYVNNPTYTIGDTVKLQWSTDQDSYQIWLWQQILGGGASQGSSIFAKLPDSSPRTTFNWTVTALNSDLSQSNVFFLALGPTPDLDSDASTSHYFNLTQYETTSNQSPGSGTIVSSATALSRTTNSLFTSSATTSSSSSPQPSSFGQSSGASDNSSPIKLGLGLGLGLGIPILIILVAIALLLSRGSRGERSMWYGVSQSRSAREIQLTHGNVSPSLQFCELENNDAAHQVKSWPKEPPQYYQTPSVELPGRPCDVQRPYL